MLVVLLAAYLVLAVGYSVVTPIYEPTDEIRHFRYVRHLAVYRRLPVQSADGPRAQSHHPPLYYALGALVSWWVPIRQEVYYEPPRNPHWTSCYDEVSVYNKNQYIQRVEERFPYRGVTLAVHVVRWLSVLIGAGVVWLTFRLGREVFPDRPALAMGGASIVAFNPQFLHLSGAVNNDVPAAFWGAAILLACVRVIRRGPDLRSDVTLGILYGLALLTKFHLLALAVPIGLAYALAAWRSRGWRHLLRGGAVILSVAALVSGWWFWRNYVLYGDPTGMTKVNELWAGRSPAGNWWALRQGLPYLWSSLWGRFGYGQIPLHRGLYTGLLAFCVLALVGHLLPRADRPRHPSLLVLAVTPLVTFTVVCYYILIQPAGAMGRFLFPALPAFSLLVIFGLSRFFPDQLVGAATLGVTAGMVALAIYALVGVLGPAFGRPRRLAQPEVASLPNPMTVQFGGVGRLLGYQVDPTQVEPGDTVDVTLYWQALARTDEDYTVFVHLLSDVGTMIAQCDTYPGLGRYPTTVWDPGVAFADTYEVHVPQTAYAPDTGYLQVGLYLANGPRLLTADGRDAVRLTAIEIQERADGFPNPQDVDFGHRIALVGYSLDRRVVQPGEAIRLTLYWRPLSRMERDHRAFAHVLDSDNGIRANSDSLLLHGSVPTSRWELGQVVKEERVLSVAPDTPPGFYDIEVGLHEVSGGRLPVMGKGDHRKGYRVLLSKISVEGQ
jgi:4-amino-4-deoxy-L-arabinose transferase-like glycosyltransferase